MALPKFSISLPAGRQAILQFSLNLQYLNIQTINKTNINHTSIMQYDLEERTQQFGEEIITLCKSTKRSMFTLPILDQLIRSGTSIGANYMEANGASSKKDFRNKIFICKKESQETKHWLRMLGKAIEKPDIKIEEVRSECQELIMIFHKITQTIDHQSKK